MNNSANLPYPGSVWTPGQSFVASSQTQRLSTSPNAVRVDWWRAIPNPSYDKSKALIAHQQDETEYLRELQEGEFFVIVSESSTMIRRFFPQGVWESGTVAISYDPLELPLSIYDWIFPRQRDLPNSVLPNARVYTAKETVKRGGSLVPGVGLLASNGASIVGTGTYFSTFFQPGDVLSAAGQARRVTTVTNNTHLTLESAVPTWVGMEYAKGIDRLDFSPIARLSLVRDAATTYMPDIDCSIGTEGETIQWLSPSASPPPSATYSVIYDWYPRYEITDMGQKPTVIKGYPQLTTQVAHLWKPESIHR